MLLVLHKHAYLTHLQIALKTIFSRLRLLCYIDVIIYVHFEIQRPHRYDNKDSHSNALHKDFNAPLLKHIEYICMKESSYWSVG